MGFLDDIGGAISGVVSQTARSIEEVAGLNPDQGGFVAVAQPLAQGRLELHTLLETVDMLPEIWSGDKLPGPVKAAAKPERGSGNGQTLKIADDGFRSQVMFALTEQSINRQFQAVHERSVELQQVFFRADEHAVLTGQLNPFRIRIPPGQHAAQQDVLFLILSFQTGSIRLKSAHFDLAGWELAFSCSLADVSISATDLSVESLLQQLCTKSKVTPDADYSVYGRHPNGDRISYQEWRQQPLVRQQESNLNEFLEKWMTGQPSPRTHFGHQFEPSAPNALQRPDLPIAHLQLFCPVAYIPDAHGLVAVSYLLFAEHRINHNDTQSPVLRAFAEKLQGTRSEEGVYAIYQPDYLAFIRAGFRKHCASLAVETEHYGLSEQAISVGVSPETFDQIHEVSTQNHETMTEIHATRQTFKSLSDCSGKPNIRECRECTLMVDHALFWKPISGTLALNSDYEMHTDVSLDQFNIGFRGRVQMQFTHEFARDGSGRFVNCGGGWQEDPDWDRVTHAPEQTIDDIYSPKFHRNAARLRTDLQTAWAISMQAIEALLDGEVHGPNRDADDSVWHQGALRASPAETSGVTRLRSIYTANLFSNVKITGTHPEPSSSPADVPSTGPSGKESTRPVTPTQPVPSAPAGERSCKLCWTVATQPAPLTAGEPMTIILEARNTTSSVQHFGYLQVRFPVSGDSGSGLLEAPDAESTTVISVQGPSTLKQPLTARVSSLPQGDETWQVVELKPANNVAGAAPISIPAGGVIRLELGGTGGSPGSHAIWVAESWVSAKGAPVDRKEDALDIQID